MSLLFSPSPVLLPSLQNLRRATTISISSQLTPTILFRFPQNPFKKTRTLSISAPSTSSSTETKITDFDSVVDELEPDEDDLTASPWEGAVVYRRDASVSHVEYSTTLERLGLAKLASELSRSRASVMGIRLPVRMAKDSNLANETPVLISVDVTRRKRRLKLDGILRTVITLRCNSRALKEQLTILGYTPHCPSQIFFGKISAWISFWEFRGSHFGSSVDQSKGQPYYVMGDTSN